MFTLLEAGIPVLLANPQQTKETQEKKTGRFDARRIAVAHRDGRLKPSVISPEETMQLRKNMWAVLRLVSEQTKNMQRLHQLYHWHDFTLHKKNKGFLKNKWSLTLLQQFLNNDKVIKELVDWLCPKSQGKRTAAGEARIADITKGLERFKTRLAPLGKAGPQDRDRSANPLRRAQETAYSDLLHGS